MGEKEANDMIDRLIEEAGLELRIDIRGPEDVRLDGEFDTAELEMIVRIMDAWPND